MTNHWADIANSTCVIAWGANPAENHPACIAHVNRGRFPKQFYPAPDVRGDKTAAKLIVIDPRKTRTALQVDESRGDKYVRIRPGTDIALANGLIKYIIDQMESPTSTVPAATKTAFFAYLNQTGNGTFFTDGNATAASTSVTTVPGNSKYTDARFLVNTSTLDYQRDRIVATTGAVTAAAPDNTTISNFPLKAATVDADPATVYNQLKAHVAPYTLAVTADICGCSTADIQFIGNAFIANSRCSDVNGLVAGDPRNTTYRAVTMLYAMGITQHTCGGQNVKSFAQLQTLMGNMGRAGGGINALRGIHNVQGSTDMGLLYGNIPAYSGNPTVQVTAIPDTTTNAFGQYMNALWGNPVSGSTGTTDFTGTVRSLMNTSYDDAYNTGAMALQQRGFYNMTLKFFGGYAASTAATTLSARRAIVDTAYSLWPKGNGDNHIEMFRKMGSGSVKAAVVWGQNPAVTEPNQGAVRTGLETLETLVCVDMFANETALCSRNATGVTYLIPSCSHVEKAGSATNSGRTLQWRYQATQPLGNSKDDTELLLRFAKAIDQNGATAGVPNYTATAPYSGFKHIKDAWTAASLYAGINVWDELYGNQYGWTTGAYKDVALASTDYATPGTTVSAGTTYALVTVTGSEAITEKVFQEMCTASASGGTIWIYTAAYNATLDKSQLAALYSNWAVKNRAKSRDREDPYNSLLSSKWGYSWLVNRRVLYGNGEVTGDQNDFFMGPDSCARLFVSTSTAVLNYSRWYRTIHRLADKPSSVVNAVTASPHWISPTVTLAGRFCAHVEPYETPRADLAADTKWGRNTKGTAAWDLVKTDTPVAGRGLAGDPAAATFPLVLTTIRCVEHFQGGPITRNNWWNVELEPEPWIELNQVDARKYGIRDGDMVKIVTARTEPLVNNELPNYGSGFRARVGAGVASSQKIAAGVVAIPWHWGEAGLSTGSRANDLTIDAMDANTTIPEYKACLCRIEKIS